MTQYPRIGFCCKWLDPDRTQSRKALADSERPMNQSSTTLTKLNSLSQRQQYERIWDITHNNVDVLWRQLRWIAQQPAAMRMFRITSGFIPGSTLAQFDHVLKDHDFLKTLEHRLKGIRQFADANGIRLCTHPGQFTNLCSDNPEVVKRSIEDLEYHADLARFMGYGDTWHSSGFAINIHANSRQDPGLKQVRRVLANDVSPEVRNLITLENDEFGCSVDDLLAAKADEDLALVLDIHHHWVQSKGEYILPSDERSLRFYDSWRGMRPLGHYSQPQQELMPTQAANVAPDFSKLGLSQSKLRSHSDLMWNQANNTWACFHLAEMDLEIEAKGKNLASKQFYDYAKSMTIVM